jgi:hypothetical protein
MFESSHKPVDSGNTLTAFLLAVAFVLIPAALLFLRPMGFVSLGLGIVVSALCVTIAWVNWKPSSRIEASVSAVDEKRK